MRPPVPETLRKSGAQKWGQTCSTDQNPDAQTDALTAAGCGRLFAEKVSGSKRTRSKPDKSIDQLSEGDVAFVAKYDQLARSLKDLLEIVGKNGAGFLSVAEDIDTRRQLAVPFSESSPLPYSSNVSGYWSGLARAWWLHATVGGRL